MIYSPLLGYPKVCLLNMQPILESRERGERNTNGYTAKQAFTYDPHPEHKSLMCRNGYTPIVLDVTAGGGSIPFEAGRLGLKTIANELNPVAAFILRATCEWPQRYGYMLLSEYRTVAARFQKRVDELTEAVYPPEPQPTLKEFQEILNIKYAGKKVPTATRAKRYLRGYLFARVALCPSCNGAAPLSPNWRLNSRGKGDSPVTQHGKESMWL